MVRLVRDRLLGLGWDLDADSVGGDDVVGSTTGDRVVKCGILL